MVEVLLIILSTGILAGFMLGLYALMTRANATYRRGYEAGMADRKINPAARRSIGLPY